MQYPSRLTGLYTLPGRIHPQSGLAHHKKLYYSSITPLPDYYQ
jgi:hypothetical protein